MTDFEVRLAMPPVDQDKPYENPTIGFSLKPPVEIIDPELMNKLARGKQTDAAKLFSRVLLHYKDELGVYGSIQGNLSFTQLGSEGKHERNQRMVDRLTPQVKALFELAINPMGDDTVNVTAHLQPEQVEL